MVIVLNRFMLHAIDEAQKALLFDEVPVGALVVCDNKIISTAHNFTRTKCDVTAHAEILAIKAAEEFLADWRLDNCELYVTLEPCMMCMGAIINSRIKRLYFGAFDKELGFALSNHFTVPHGVEVYGGICEEKCEKLLKDFFVSRRK